MNTSSTIVPPVEARSLQFDPEVLRFWAEAARIQRVTHDTVAAYLG